MIHPSGTLALWAATASILAAVLTALIALIVLVRLPADAFTADDPHRTARVRTPRRLLLDILRNGAGWILVVVGLVLSIPGVPGQGLLTILVGLLILDFPGRTLLLRRLLNRPSLRRGLDHLRARFGKPPIKWDARS